jgi:hypothetical protein
MPVQSKYYLANNNGKLTKINFKGRVELKGLVIQYMDESILRPLFPSGNYVLELDFFDADKNSSAFQINIEIFFKGLYNSQ